MKVRARRLFHDRAEGVFREEGDVWSVSPERFMQLRSFDATLVEPVALGRAARQELSALAGALGVDAEAMPKNEIVKRLKEVL